MEGLRHKTKKSRIDVEAESDTMIRDIRPVNPNEMLLARISMLFLAGRNLFQKD